MVLVTFKNSYDETVCMMTQKFKTVKDAKQAIEDDAYAFAMAHNNGDIHTYRRWVEPNDRDFHKVIGKDGVSCVWQYFCI